MKKILQIFGLIMIFSHLSYAASQLLIIGPGQTLLSGVSGNGRAGGSEITSQQTSGSYFYVTVYACDALWNIDTVAAGTVTLSSSDPQATTPTAAPLVSGAAIMRVTMGTAGTMLLTANHGVYAADSDNIPVTHGVLDHFNFTSVLTDKTANQLFQIYAAAHDAYNNTVTSFNNSVTLEALKGGSTPLASSHWYKSQSSPIFNNGIINGSVLMRIYERTTTCSLRLTYNTATGTSNTFAVNSGTFSRLVIMAPGETYNPGAGNPPDSGKTGVPATQAAGSDASFSVYSTDAYANMISSVNDTIEITSSDFGGLANGVTLPVQTALSSGTGSFNFSFMNSGTQGIYCNDVTTAGISAGSVIVPVQPGPLSYFSFSVMPANVSAGAGVSQVISARDIFGNLVTAYTGNAWITAPDTDWTLPSESTIEVTGGNKYGSAWYVTFTAGQAYNNITFLRAGSARIFVCDDPAGTTQNAAGHRGLSSAVTVNYGSISRLQVIPPGIAARPGTVSGFAGTAISQTVGTPFSVTVNACDAYWNVISIPGATGGSDTISLASNDNNNTLAARPGQPLQTPPVLGFLNSGTAVMNVSYFLETSLFSLTASDASRGGIDAGLSTYINVSTAGSSTVYLPGRFKITGPGGANIGIQTAGVPFVISITAYTDDTQTVPDAGFNGAYVEMKASNQYSDSEYCLTPAHSVTFTAGIAVMPVTMYRASVTWMGGGVEVFLKNGAETSISNTFSLKWGPADRALIRIAGMIYRPGLVQVGIPGYKGYYGSPVIAEAGQPFQADIFYTDMNYNRVFDYPQAYCRLTSSDPKASVGSTPALLLSPGFVYVTITAGAFSSADMRLCTAGISGIQTLTAEPGGSFLNNTSPQISIRHSTADHLGVWIPPGEWTAGIPRNITVQALDAWQNVCGASNGGIPFNNTVSLIAGTGTNTMYPQQYTLNNGQAVVSTALYKAPELNTFIAAYYASVSGKSSAINTKSNYFSRLLVMDMVGGMTRMNGQYTGLAPSVFPMAAGAPFSLDPSDAAVSLQASVSPYDHYAKEHSFIIYSCDAYGNVTTTPELAGNTVTVSINDTYAQPITPTVIDALAGYSLVDAVFHTAKSGMYLRAHTTQAGVADYDTPTFTTYAGPAFGMQMLVPGMTAVDGSGMTSGAFSVWYNGVTGVPDTQASGTAFPVTVRASDIFGNFKTGYTNQVNVFALTSPFINAYPASFPTNENRFTGYLGEFSPGMLTLTARYDVTQSMSVLMQIDDLSLAGPWCLDRVLIMNPVIPIQYGTLSPTQTMTGTPVNTVTATPTATAELTATETTVIFTQTYTQTQTCTMTQTCTLTLTLTETIQPETPTPTVTSTVQAGGFAGAAPEQGTSYVYPQPAKSTASFVYFLEKQKEVTISVYDLSGALKIMKKYSGSAMTVNNAVMDISGLPSGLYVYTISAGGQTGGSNINFKAGKLVILR